MGEALNASTSDSRAPTALPDHIAEFLAFQTELDREDADKESSTHAETSSPPAPADVPNLVAVAPSPIVVGSDDGAIATLPVSEIAAQPSGSSTTPVPVDDSEVAPESGPPPPSKRGIVLGLRAPSATPTVSPRGVSDSGLIPQHRAKFVSLIDGMINDCGSQVERVTKELAESHSELSQLEEASKAIEGAHSLEVLQTEARIGELERDLGKTPSSLLKAKQAKKAKSS
ncbi:hypothetical protein F2Q68_00015636 [Brassica cretica]|uniref:Uncharacterized protein n=2 Tax=Brassica cretica TaxID=69181 RepID=A0A8S9HFU1_BRACR|nr:hypothetical protein F2Q68_00015636 [Brassica cretica]KAF3610766.1 hypothetical protein DY000_02048237 [Brassica cretica]